MQFRNVDKRRLVLVVLAVVLLGFTLSFLNKTNMGTDPCSLFTLGLSRKLGISMGNIQAMLNSLLLIIVIFCDRSQIGWGTLANMFLVGYSFDFFTWLNSLWIPDEIYTSMAVRIGITIPMLFIFVMAAAVYMAVQLGTAPYDAIPFIIAKKLPNIPFKLVRMAWDISFSVLGVLLGSTLGIVTAVMAFALGPVISWASVKLVDKLLK